MYTETIKEVARFGMRAGVQTLRFEHLYGAIFLHKLEACPEDSLLDIYSRSSSDIKVIVMFSNAACVDLLPMYSIWYYREGSLSWACFLNQD